MADAQSQPNSPGANPEELVEVEVAGRIYTDWETVWIQHRWGEGVPMFRLTTAERDPMEELWSRLQIAPGDLVKIKLGGEIAITGVVTVRQTAYDANSHGVAIQGVGIQWFAFRGSIIHPTQNFKGGFVSIAQQVLAPFDSKPRVIGEIDPTPFNKDRGINSNTGETVWQFLSRLAPDRKVVLGADVFGNILLIGPHWNDAIGPSQGIDRLEEGVNILSCQALIDVTKVYSKYMTRGQTGRSDEGSPADAAQQESQPIDSNTLKIYSPLMTPIEHPVWTKREVDLRNQYEATWHEGTIIEATILVQGFFTRYGKLWEAGQDVVIQSPMAMLPNELLALRSVTFTQDRSSGSRTTLDCVAPWYLQDYSVPPPGAGRAGLPAPPVQETRPVNPTPPTPATPAPPPAPAVASVPAPEE